MYIIEFIQTYEITLKSEADYVEAIWCNIVTNNLKLTIGVVYRSPYLGTRGRCKTTKGYKRGEHGGMCYNG